MASAKETVQKVLDHLPDDCTMDQIMDRIYVVQLIESRLKDADDPDAVTYTTEEVIERLRAKGAKL